MKLSLGERPRVKLPEHGVCVLGDGFWSILQGCFGVTSVPLPSYLLSIQGWTSVLCCCWGLQSHPVLYTAPSSRVGLPCIQTALCWRRKERLKPRAPALFFSHQETSLMKGNIFIGGNIRFTQDRKVILLLTILNLLHPN